MKAATIVQTWDRIREGLIGTIEKFTEDDLDYIAFENGYSVRQIILHIAQEEYGEIQYGLTRKIDAFPHPFRDDIYRNVESIKTLLGEVHGETIKYLRLTGRSEPLVEAVEWYYREQGMWRDDANCD